MCIRDYNLGQPVRKKFPSVNGNGTPAALNNGTVVIYRDGNLTEITTNFTLTSSFDNRPGVNEFLTDGNTTVFPAGSDYAAVLATGDVEGRSVANMTFYEWSVNNQPGTMAANLTMLSDMNQTINNANQTISSISSVGSSGGQTVELTYRTILASPPPMALPSATTSITALFAFNNLTFPTASICLEIQAQGGPIMVDQAGVNATANGSIFGANQTVVASKKANENNINLGDIHVARGAAGATVKFTCK